MKKFIVLSVNDNVDYLFFTPLTVWAWRKFGWEPIVFYYGERNKYDGKMTDLPFSYLIAYVDNIPGYRSDTITQISRLYGACIVNDAPSYIMTSDIDMLPLSNYWRQDLNKITVFGHDLTGFGHFPICYIGMPAQEWCFVMNIKNVDYNCHIKRDLDTLPQAKDPDFYKFWFTDQDLITARLKEYGTSKIDFINRGQGKHGYARGRVDRGNGGWVLDQPELIDAHLEQQTWQNPAKLERLYQLLAHVWPTENFDWFKKYSEEFKKLAV